MPCNRFHIEVPVIIFTWQPILETDHRRNRIASLEIGVIKTFNMNGHIGKLKVCLQLVQHLLSFHIILAFQLQNFFLLEFFAEIVHVLF